jgi:hypothetical protein
MSGVHELRARIDKWDQMEKFLHSKENNHQMEWEKNFANYSSDKRLICRIYEDLKQLNTNIKKIKQLFLCFLILSINMQMN